MHKEHIRHGYALFSHSGIYLCKNGLEKQSKIGILIMSGGGHVKLFKKDEFLADELKYYFIKNKIQPGMKLPSERELAEQYGVQRATVRSAYRMLEEEGIIEIQERSGRYMGHERIVTDLRQIKSFSEKLNHIGIRTENKLLAFELIEVDKQLSGKIKLPIGTSLNKITRVRKVWWKEELLPILIEYAYVPESIADKLIKYDLEENSLFDILRNGYGRIPKREEQVIEIVYADEFEAKTLKVDKMTPLVLKDGITYDGEGNILQYIHAVMNKDWFSFEQRNEQIEQKMGAV